jgi:periplasmic protein TonB
VQVLISPKGRVQKARVIRSIDPQLGLDREALTTARRWRFRPATKNGEPVAVTAVIELSFRLKS